jgi:very-short-patch-repair endonuclease
MASKYHVEVGEHLRKIFPLYTIKEEVSMYIDGVTKDRRAKKLHVDWFVRELCIAVEVDGQHHYQSVDYGDGLGEVNLERRQYLDRLKDSIAYENDWLMIRIPYDIVADYEKVERYVKGIVFNKTQ